MACELCEKMEGVWTCYDAEFNAAFNVIDSISTTMTSTGTAECKTCGQKVEFDFDDTLIPKLRVRFLKKN